MNNYKVVALLPMKGHSERVPNKNLKSFMGRPLYHRVMRTLQESKIIEKIIVNTDSEEIKKDIQINFPEKVIINDRPKEICGDFVPMNKIIEHDLHTIDSALYIQTHSTNPFLRTLSINTALQTMNNFLKDGENYDSIFSVTRMQTRLYRSGAVPINHDPEVLLRTQDLEPVFEENSNFYIFSKRSFQENGMKRIGKKPFMFPVEKIEALDIDEPEDFLIAETLYRALYDL